MRKTLLLSLLVMLAAAFAVAPAMASASIVDQQSGEPLEAGSQLNAAASAFQFQGGGNTVYCNEGPAFSAELIDNEAPVVTAGGLGGQAPKQCYVNNPQFPTTLTSFGVPGEIELSPDGTGKIPLAFVWDFKAWGMVCHYASTVPFTWTNEGAAGSLEIQIQSQQVKASDCGPVLVSTTFTVTGENGQSIEA